MLKNTQGQILQQKLSPQAIQAQLLLAIPTIALEQEIKKQLEDNPVLEDDIDSKQQTEKEISEFDSYDRKTGEMDITAASIKAVLLKAVMKNVLNTL